MKHTCCNIKVSKGLKKCSSIQPYGMAKIKFNTITKEVFDEAENFIGYGEFNKDKTEIIIKSI